MKKYREPKQLDLPQIDKEILSFWENNGIFKKSITQRPESESIAFYEGPPSANGMPGIHHVMGRTVKDLFCRFHTMQGKRVLRKAGWDTHGLPVELKVERELGITKEDIGKSISVAEYNQKCRESVMRFTEEWENITRIMGYWVDMNDPYVTYHNNYIETLWWMLRQLYDKGLLYKGYSVQPYSPAAGTGLSSHELNLPGAYQDVTDTSAVAQFTVVRNEDSEFLFENKDEDVRFIAWTTTPWTLPSNTALAVGNKIEYVKVDTFNPYTFERVSVILAKDLLAKWFNAENENASFADFENLEDKKRKLIPYRILDEFAGDKLEGIRYEQLLPYAQPEEGDAFKVLIGDFVSTSDGTGIVHLAPSFGSDDMATAKKYGIGALTLVDKSGKFTDETGEFAGRYVKNYKDDADWKNPDIDISILLKTDNKAFHVEKYVHSYPHCWRTDKPVLYYPLDSWFIRSTASKERMYELNKTINWQPTSTGEGRFGKWLENLQDWNLSRSRYWGTPLPIWRTDDGEKEICIGSLKELSDEIEKANKALGLDQSMPEDMHRPYIDEVTLVSEDGRPMKREDDLIDVWFDSGAMPYAQLHYPFENKDVFSHSFPADFIAEGVDQTRGWFFTLHALGTMVFDSIAFKNVVSNGLVLDANGNKMSKSRGNTVNPFDTLDKFGADATRWYMMSNSNPWDNLRFDLDGIKEVQRKLFGTLFHTYSFFALYANIDDFQYKNDASPFSERPEMDRWIISLLNTLIKEVTEDYKNYDPTPAARRIQDFVVENLSNWYVRLGRRRFWQEDRITQQNEGAADKLAAYHTLYECLNVLTKLMAPNAPFFSDWLYRNLNEATGLEDAVSVHLTDFPAANEQYIDKELEQSMQYAQTISSLILSLRKKTGIRVRQPLQRALLPVLDIDFEKRVQRVENLILSEVNIKKLEYITGSGGIIEKSVKPNFKTLGSRMGKQMKAAAKAISAMTQDDIEQLENDGKFTVSFDGENHELDREDFIIASKDIPGWEVASNGRLTVALDTTLTDELIAEGTARELIKQIQTMRKDQGLEVTDRVVVTIEEVEAVKAALATHSDYIQAETLADELQVANSISEGTALALDDDQETKILVVKSK